MSLHTLVEKILSDSAHKAKFDEKTESELAIRVGAKIQQLRAFSGFTQEQLAEKIKSQQPNIARMESGKSLPSLKTLFKLAQAVGTHVIEPDFAALIEREKKLSLNIITNNSQKYVFTAVTNPDKSITKRRTADVSQHTWSSINLQRHTALSTLI